MNNIYIEIMDAKSGKTQCEKVGYVLAELTHEQDKITIDDFEGSGDTYKQREHQLIEIIENGKVLFSGNKEELFKILKGK